MDADWSQAAIGKRRATLAELEKRWRASPVRTEVPAEIDRRLLGSTLARVRWELDITAGWRRDPSFYVAQALCGPIEISARPAALRHPAEPGAGCTGSS